MRLYRAALIVLLLLPAPALAKNLSVDGLARLTRALEADVAAGHYPGAVVLIEKDGKVAYHEAIGRLRPGDDVPMPRDALFRIASMTKPITSVASLMLVERGELGLDRSIGEHLPGFDVPRVLLYGGKTRPAMRPIQTRDLLRHTSGMIYGVFAPSTPLGRLYTDAGIWPQTRPLDDWTDALAQLPLASDPGSRWRYGRSTDVLGRLVEVAGGTTLDRFMAAEIFAPLSMADTGFVLPADKAARMAQMPGRAFDPTEPPAMLSGGGGLISSAADYLRFCRMLLAGGGDLLRPETVAAMTRDQLGDVPERFVGIGYGVGYGFGYGVAVRTDEADVPGTVGDYGWGGYWGTTFWIDPAERMIAIGMIQNPRHRLPFRQQLRELVYGALVD